MILPTRPPSSGSGIASVVEDTSPQLGGSLDLNGFSVGAADAADLTKLSEVTATSAELNFVDGVTSSIQTQLNAAATDTDLSNHAADTTTHGTTGDVVGTSDIQTLTNKTLTSPKINEDVAVTATATELNFVDGVTSAIQTQLDGKQPLDAGLTDIAGLAVTDGNVIVGDGANWVAESGATARASLGLTIGTHVQAFDADLTTLSTAFTSASASAAASLAFAEDTDNGVNTVALSAPAALAANRTILFQDASGTLYQTSGTDVLLADGGTGASLADPGADRMLFWDDSGGAVTWLAPGSAFAVNTTTLDRSTTVRTSPLNFVMDGGGSPVGTGVKGWVRIPWAWSDIAKATITSDQACSAVVDIWKDSFANYPPTDADSITAAAPPTLSGPDNEAEDSTLTGWTKTGSAGDFLYFNVDSNDVAEILVVTLDLVRSV